MKKIKHCYGNPYLLLILPVLIGLFLLPLRHDRTSKTGSTALALYRQPEILILDEATSSLDPTAEQYVQRAVDHLTAQGKTVIVIAHRLSTVQRAHKIIVLHEGQLAGEGTHTELMQAKGRYYQLWTQQMPLIST